MSSQVSAPMRGLAQRLMLGWWDRRPIAAPVAASVCVAGEAYRETRADWSSDEELTFRQERAVDALRTMRVAFLLGTAAFLSFMALDAMLEKLTAGEIVCRIGASLTLSVLFLASFCRRFAGVVVLVNGLARAAAVLLLLELVATLLIDQDRTAYGELWPALLPIYFVTYGQLVLPVADARWFGGATAIIVPLTGYFVGVETNELMTSALMLLIVNLFGLFTRCRLESYSRRLFTLRRQAESLAEEKAQFMRQAAHNLRQPLQALSCHSLVLESALGGAEAAANLCVTARKMGLAIDALNQSFDRILDLANLELGRQMPMLTEIDLNTLLNDLDSQFAPQATRKGLKLVVRLRQRQPLTIRSDASILWQVLCNLVDNAIKYTPSGWVLVCVARGQAGVPRFVVRDTGIGIPEAQQQMVFEEFTRAHRRESDPRVAGLGIGLAYVKKAIQRVAGLSLTFTSRPNRGTVFRIGVAGVVEGTAAATELEQARTELRGTQVLLVEDDPEVRSALAAELRCWDCQVEQVGTLDEVRLYLADCVQPPDLLITDFYLDQSLTAHDVIAAMEAEFGQGAVSTLVLSAGAIPQEDKQRWGDSVALLRKPAGPKQLYPTLRKLLTRNREA